MAIKTFDIGSEPINHTHRITLQNGMHAFPVYTTANQNGDF